MVFVPDQYACGIALKGFYDMRVLLRDARDVSQLAQNTFNSALIRNRRDYSDEDMVRFSPALHADEVKGPIMLVVGDRDQSTDQVTIMRSRLTEKGKTVEFVSLPDEAGYLTAVGNRTMLLNSIDRFLASRIGK